MQNHLKNVVNDQVQDIFGCSEKVFLDIIKDAYLSRIETTKNHPKSYGGIRQYNETICFIREQLLSLGYVPYENTGSNWAIHKKLNVGITAMAGNAWVGKEGGFSSNQTALRAKRAKNRNPRGTMFAKIANAQLANDLFSQNQKPDFLCWVLMYFIDYRAKVIRSELSCPSKMTPDGKYIEQYYERIILSEISIDQDQEIEDNVLPKQFMEESNEFDFPVTFKKEVNDG